MRALYARPLLWLMQTKFYYWLLIEVIPYIRFTTYYTSFRGYQYHAGYALLQPGDIILTRDNKKLTTVLIPGEMTHAAMCVSKDGKWEISEMTHENYVKNCFFDLCKEADRVVIMRCTDFDPDYTQKVIEKCKSFVGAQYNIEFEFGIKALYCSELDYQSDFERRWNVSLEDLAGLGRPYISPTGFLHARNGLIVYDSDNYKNPNTDSV